MKITQSCACGASQTVDGSYDADVLKAARDWRDLHLNCNRERSADGSEQVLALEQATQAKP